MGGRGGNSGLSSINMQKKLENMGYKVWEKGDKKRIYINDYDKYMDVQKIEGGMGRGRIVNGISTENMNSITQKKVIHFIEDSKFNGFKIYYDLNDKSFHSSSTKGSPVIADIVKTIVDKIKKKK